MGRQPIEMKGVAVWGIVGVISLIVKGGYGIRGGIFTGSDTVYINFGSDVTIYTNVKWLPDTEFVNHESSEKAYKFALFSVFRTYRIFRRYAGGEGGAGGSRDGQRVGDTA